MAAMPEENSHTSAAATFISPAMRSRIAAFSLAPSLVGGRLARIRSATRDDTIWPVCCQ